MAPSKARSAFSPDLYRQGTACVARAAQLWAARVAAKNRAGEGQPCFTMRSPSFTAPIPHVASNCARHLNARARCAVPNASRSYRSEHRRFRQSRWPKLTLRASRLQKLSRMLRQRRAHRRRDHYLRWRHARPLPAGCASSQPNRHGFVRCRGAGAKSRVESSCLRPA